MEFKDFLGETPIAVLCDWDFDDTIWAYSFDKSNIRIVLHRK